METGRPWPRGAFNLLKGTVLGAGANHVTVMRQLKPEGFPSLCDAPRLPPPNLSLTLQLSAHFPSTSTSAPAAQAKGSSLLPHMRELPSCPGWQEKEEETRRSGGRRGAGGASSGQGTL